MPVRGLCGVLIAITPMIDIHASYFHNPKANWPCLEACEQDFAKECPEVLQLLRASLPVFLLRAPKEWLSVDGLCIASPKYDGGKMIVIGLGGCSHALLLEVCAAQRCILGRTTFPRKGNGDPSASSRGDLCLRPQSLVTYH